MNQLILTIILELVIINDGQKITLNDENLENKKYLINIKGKPGYGYYIQIAVGTPKQLFNVLLDTGSSNFALAGPMEFEETQFYPNKSSSAYNHNILVSVLYSQGHWNADLFNDIMSFTTIDNIDLNFSTNVAVINKSENFFIKGSNWQGILGLGYPKLMKPDSSVLPVFDEAVKSKIVDNIFSMQLCGTNTLDRSDEESTGTLVLGAIEQTLYTGIMLYTPVIKQWYYEVVITDISVDGSSLGFECDNYNKDRTIVDSGTTNWRLENRVFEALIKKLKTYDEIDVPDDFWNGQQIMCWDYNQTPYDYFPNIEMNLLHFGKPGYDFKLTISPQLYLRETVDSRFVENQRCFRFSITKSDQGTVIGAIIMEGFYVVFDRKNSRIGFATSTCPTKGKLNTKASVKGPFKKGFNITKCSNIDKLGGEFTSTIISFIYISAFIMTVTIIPVIFYLIRIIHSKQLNRGQLSTN